MEKKIYQSPEIRELNPVEFLRKIEAEEIFDNFSFLFKNGIPENLKNKFDYEDLNSLKKLNTIYKIHFINESEVYTENEIQELLGMSWGDFLRGCVWASYLINTLFISSVKEDLLSKRFNNSDLGDIDGFIDGLRILKPQKRESRKKYPKGKLKTGKDLIEAIGYGNVMEEIRNGLMHNRYIILRHGIYINNPVTSNHSEHFEAFISKQAMESLVNNVFSVIRKPNCFYAPTPNENESYEQYKNRVKHFEYNKKSDNYIKPPLIYEKDYNDFLESGGLDNYNDIGNEEVFNGTNPMCDDLLDEYYTKYKLKDVSNIDYHKTTFSNAILFTHSSADLHVAMLEHIGMLIPDYLMNGGSKNDKNMKVGYFNYIFSKMKSGVLKGHPFKHDYLNNIYQELTVGDVFNRDLWDVNKIKKTIKERIIKGKLKYMNCIDAEIDKIYAEEIEPIVVILYENLLNMQFIFDLIPNYLKILYISKRYINNPRLVPVRKGDYIPKKEHIRNAFAHGNFAILPGIDKVSLRDPSQDKNNPDWHKTYSINDLYKHCVSNARYNFGLSK